MNIIDCDPSQLMGKKFRFIDLPDPSGRVEFYAKPEPGHLYVVGADFAYGIEGRDYDAAVILDKTVHQKTGVAPQVGELHGRWGERFHTILYASMIYWLEGFLLGERQVGLFTLRTLFDRYQLRYMYYEKDLTSAAGAETASMKLGHHKSANDLVMAKLRAAIRNRTLDLRSTTTIEQMAKLQWRGPSSEERTLEREPDERLKIKLSGGGSPDLVMATAYANMALECVHQFVKPSPRFQPGSFGDMMGLAESMPDLYGTQEGGVKWH